MKNEQHSHKAYMRRTFLDDDPAEWAGEVWRTCFGRETPDTQVLPPGATCTFIECNLSNVAIPPGCIVGEGCQTTRFLWQDDEEDWIVDDQGNPIEPLDKKRFERDGESTDPADIPTRALLTRRQREEARTIAERELVG